MKIKYNDHFKLNAMILLLEENVNDDKYTSYEHRDGCGTEK